MLNQMNNTLDLKIFGLMIVVCAIIYGMRVRRNRPQPKAKPANVKTFTINDIHLEITVALLDSGINRQQPVKSLMKVLESAHELVALSGNDFSQTHWQSSEQAQQYLIFLLDQLKEGVIPEKAWVADLFKSKGALQTVGENSGWVGIYNSLHTLYSEVESLIWPPTIT
jgi:hypothetical protein